MTTTNAPHRSLAFSTSTEPRLWWHRLPRSNYVPPIYASLTDEEWRVVAIKLYLLVVAQMVKEEMGDEYDRIIDSRFATTPPD